MLEEISVMLLKLEQPQLKISITMDMVDEVEILIFAAVVTEASDEVVVVEAIIRTTTSILLNFIDMISSQPITGTQEINSYVQMIRMDQLTIHSSDSHFFNFLLLCIKGLVAYVT